MKHTVLTLWLGASALYPSAALAADARVPDAPTLQLFDDIAKSVNRYVWFTIFDDVSADISGGVVTLSGKVTMPYKKSDLEKRVAQVAGVTSVVNQLEVLPVSGFDDQLRVRVARAIYGHFNFWHYAHMANPPIHIVVDRGRVTLTGVVNSEVDRALARSLAVQFGAMSIASELKTDAEVRAALNQP